MVCVVEDSDATRTDSTSALHQRINICQDISDMNVCFAQQPGNKAVISPSEVLHQRTCEKQEKRDTHHRGYRKRFSQLSHGIRQVFNPLNDFKTDLDRGNSHVIHRYRWACVIHCGKCTMKKRGNQIKRGMRRMHRFFLYQFPSNQKEFPTSKSFFWVGNTTIVMTNAKSLSFDQQPRTLNCLDRRTKLAFLSFLLKLDAAALANFSWPEGCFWRGNSKMRNLEGSIYQRCGFISPFVWMKCTRNNGSYRIHVE